MNTARLTKFVRIIAPIECYSGYRYFRYSKYHDRSPNPGYFNTQIFIVYLRAIEKLICHRENEFNRVFFLRFCTNYDT